MMSARPYIAEFRFDRKDKSDKSFATVAELDELYAFLRALMPGRWGIAIPSPYVDGCARITFATAADAAYAKVSWRPEDRFDAAMEPL